VDGPTLRDYRDVVRRAHRRDPSFVYPDVGFLSRLLSGRAAYLRHGSSRAFFVPAEAFAVGFVDPRVQKKHGRAVGTIGFFEALSRPAALEVLDRASEWLASKGVSEAWAPVAGNPFYGVGLREDRFAERPFLGCAHQPPAYRDYLRDAGWRRIGGFSNYEVDLTDASWRASSADADGITFRRASRLRFSDEVRRFMMLHNDAYREVWTEADVSTDEAVELMGRARLAVPMPLFEFAMRDGGEIGFVLSMPDVNEVLAPQRTPVTSPSGVWKIATRRRRVQAAGLLSVGVVPDEQGHGVGTALVTRACRAAHELGYRRVEYALVADSNEASRATVARFGAKLCRTFGVYGKDL
jgi:GNAT superfamily N-acetyltransferase